MDREAIRRVRSFNRTVTQRIGVLNDRYLGRGRPLGPSRILWELGPEDTDVRSLRLRLDLDSGYLSRLLRSLEGEGLVTVSPATGDKRVRRVRLTEAGQAERRTIDVLGDDLARSLLASIDEPRRSRLVEAMTTVERLLTAGLVEIGVEDPTSADAQFCMRSFFTEADERFDGGFDPTRSLLPDTAELAEPAGLLLVARLHGDPVGCGGLRLHGDVPPEIKRLWVAGAVRRLGVGRRILTELEHHARRHGAAVVRLETNRSLHEAIALYRSAGFAEVDPYNDEPYAHHWFEKDLLADEP